MPVQSRWLRVVVNAVLLVLPLGCVRGVDAQAQAQGPPVVGTADGGTRETLESIFVPPKPGAPFSLVLSTEWTKPMFGGGTFTLANRRRIMRDSSGRIYEERWILTPKGSKIPSTMNWIQIADPQAHTLLNCAVAQKRCFLLTYSDTATQEYRPMTRPSGPLPEGEGVLQHEDLGAGDVAGIPVTGVRETTTYAPGTRGNDQPMVMVREFWYSAPLGVNLRSQLESPVSGKQSFVASEVTRTEPESSFFQVPEGYTVVDQRRKPEPQPQ